MKLVDLIWKWLKTLTVDTLKEARTKLILELKVKEKEYFIGFYQPKERQLCCVYIKQYRNLRVHLTQRVEGGYYVVKQNLNKHFSINNAVIKICEQLKTLANDYEQRLNLS
jgi:hypothetical protein